MPIFEFVCEDCRSEFELLVGHREKAHCPECESNRLEKLMSTSAGRVVSNASLPITNDCPPAEMGPCKPNCCRLP